MALVPAEVCYEDADAERKFRKMAVAGRPLRLRAMGEDDVNTTTTRIRGISFNEVDPNATTDTKYGPDPGRAGKGPCLGGRRGVSLGVTWTPPSPHGSVTSFPRMPILFRAGCAIAHVNASDELHQSQLVPLSSPPNTAQPRSLRRTTSVLRGRCSTPIHPFAWPA